MSRRSLCVLYGQDSQLSTSIQTMHLSRELADWMDVKAVTMRSRGGGRAAQTERVFKTLVRPAFSRVKTDALLYGNDGLADLRMWTGCERWLYWYDAPWNYAERPPKVWQPVDWLRWRNVMTADLVFAVSATQVDLAKQARPGREGSVHYLPVGVDCRLFDAGRYDSSGVRSDLRLPDVPVIGYLGYIGEVDKRYAGQALVDAARMIADKVSAHFLVVGFGPGLKRFMADVETLGLSRRFTFTGAVPHRSVPKYLAAMDICVDTLEEGFHSMARSETKLKAYMAMGRACVATAIGENCVDLEDGICGALVPATSEGLATGLYDLCVDESKRRHFGRLARERAMQVYDWPILARRFASAVGI